MGLSQTKPIPISPDGDKKQAQSTRARERARTFQILITGGTKTRTKRRKVTMVDWSSKQKKKLSASLFKRFLFFLFKALCM